MTDILSTLQDLIEDEYSTESGEETVTVSLDEFNPNISGAQIVLEHGVQTEESYTDYLYRVDAEVKISVYVRPVNFEEDYVDAAKSTFLEIKSVLTQLFVANKYNVSGVDKVKLGIWNDEDTVVRGFGVKAGIETDTYVSSMNVICTYYVTVSDEEST